MTATIFELDALRDMRMRGNRPAGDVTIWLDDYPAAKRGMRWYECGFGNVEVTLTREDVLSRVDLRPVVGLNVQVFARRYSDRLLILFDRLKRVPANSVLCMFGDDPLNESFAWSRAEGVIDTGTPDGFGVWMQAHHRSAPNGPVAA